MTSAKNARLGGRDPPIGAFAKSAPIRHGFGFGVPPMAATTASKSRQFEFGPFKNRHGVAPHHETFPDTADSRSTSRIPSSSKVLCASPTAALTSSRLASIMATIFSSIVPMATR